VQDGENKIDEDKIKDLVGIPKITYVHNITKAIFEYDVDKALENVDIVLNEGKDITNLLWEMIKYIKDILVYKASKKLDLYSEEEINQIKQIASETTKEKLIDIVYKLSELENDIKLSTQKTIMFQAGIIKLCNKQQEASSNIEERIEKIEKYLKSGNGIAMQSNNVTWQAQNTSASSARMVTNNPVKKNNYARPANMGNTAQKSNNTTKKFSNKSEEYWPQIVNDLKQSGKIVLYTNLIGTKANEINDMTVGIEFPNGMTAFGKTVLEKQENIREISNLVSIACGKEMQIKYITQNSEVHQMSQEEDLQNLANESDIPFNIIE
jgi:DNA polymerase-3 subunit gamma/tau